MARKSLLQPPKLQKGCIKKVLELCKKTAKLRSDMYAWGGIRHVEGVDDRMIKLRPDQIQPWDADLATRTEAAQKILSRYRKLVEESEKIRRSCSGTKLVLDREHEKAYCTLSQEAGDYESRERIGRKAWTSIELPKQKVKRRDPNWKRKLDNSDSFARGLGFSLRGHKAVKQWIEKIFKIPAREAEKRRTAIVPYVGPQVPMIAV
jgi:hypothetical protein